MSNYVKKYFEDIWIHLNNLIKILTQNASVHYIVGNVSFYNNLIPFVEKGINPE